jgi:hypothetical protein
MVAMSGTLLRTVAFFAMISAATAAATAPKPQLLKRHGVVYGVRGIHDNSCKGFPPLDLCTTYTLSGTIVSVDRHPGTNRIDNFVVRTPGGRTQMQNFIDYMPAAAESLIRSGRRVRVLGTMTGMGQVAFPNDILFLGRR